MRLFVQSPALEMMRENPLSSGLDQVAKACHSKRGLDDIRMVVPGSGVE